MFLNLEVTLCPTIVLKTFTCAWAHTDSAGKSCLGSCKTGPEHPVEPYPGALLKAPSTPFFSVTEDNLISEKIVVLLPI